MSYQISNLQIFRANELILKKLKIKNKLAVGLFLNSKTVKTSDQMGQKLAFLTNEVPISVGALLIHHKMNLMKAILTTKSGPNPNLPYINSSNLI